MSEQRDRPAGDAARASGDGPARPGPAPAPGERQEKAPIRELLVAAAFDLFAERGYDGATVDDVVRRAGVGRRSFFRYFPTKEEVVFPDHERVLADMNAYLEEELLAPDPVGRVCGAALLVTRMYARDAEFSVRRYALTRKVPALKSYELSMVWRYERAIAGYLERRFAGVPEGGVRAHVIAASVVAAHNHGLRAWLRSGGRGDAVTGVDRALDLVRRTWSGSEETVVLVARRDAPMWQVVQRLEEAWREERPGE
ncbi:TetR family transcriptional regulator [Streptomyces sp. NPDC049954]|uniref:TetR family transcriptional regulator n=1 Tax=Streptomyces sp. NPDC049954 TaxID=3155779 RepID=UPI00342934D8